jgi:hypothetical protein
LAAQDLSAIEDGDFRRGRIHGFSESDWIDVIATTIPPRKRRADGQKKT